MILYFSGTGNSAHVAKQIAAKNGDEMLNLFAPILHKDYSPLTSAKPWVIVVPTYAWQIPRIVRDWLLKTQLQGNRDVYFVMTCGDGIGNADKFNRDLCTQKDWNYMGTAKIIMPENYIAMFDAPDLETSKRIIHAAQRSISKVADRISIMEPLPKETVKVMDRLLSTIVNTAFYPLCVKDKKFYVKENCTSCGLCQKLCPLSNITIQDGKPVWNGNCTHCMACICSCPAESIEYGKISEGKFRYLCPKE